jgi:hypothetical protein
MPEKNGTPLPNQNYIRYRPRVWGSVENEDFKLYMRVTDEMRVTIAALACLPLLGAARGLYPELRQVLLYPTAFIVDRPVNDGGVLSEQRRALAGESWSQGQVLLAWDEVKRGAATPGDGHNVVIHEFAHQLDQAGGRANGAPALPTAEPYRSQSVQLLKERGVDAIVSFRAMLLDLIETIESNRNYGKSDTLQVLRVLKNYDLLKDAQMDLPSATRRAKA